MQRGTDWAAARPNQFPFAVRDRGSLRAICLPGAGSQEATEGVGAAADAGWAGSPIICM